MLLQALHKYALERKLLDNLSFQSRRIFLLVPLTQAGEPRGQGFVPLTSPVQKENNNREVPGRELLLPRYPGEKNQGKASHLADPLNVVLGLHKETFVALPEEDKGPDRDAVRSFRMFWSWIEEAEKRNHDSRLKALLHFRQHHLHEVRGWIELRQNPRSRKALLEPAARLASGDWYYLAQGNTAGFEIGGSGLSAAEMSDPLWRDWDTEFRRHVFTKDDEDEKVPSSKQTLCLVTGAVGQSIARSHKPEIKGVPGLPPKGASFFSCARDAPAFSSYGFKMGENAPVSEQAAAAYALGLNDLLSRKETHRTIGDVSFCFWAENAPEVGDLLVAAMTEALPSSVGTFVKAPFAGIERQLLDADQFLSIALSANAGRVVVREWVRLSLAAAVQNLQHWFADLEIATLTGDDAVLEEEERSGPYSLFRLAATVVRESKELKKVSEKVTELYLAALKGRPPEGPALLDLLAPILAEFRSALVTDTKKKPRYPFNPSRFALIKLILLRNPNGGFMPTPHLCDTDDAAYNLGRLLCILAGLQDLAHEYELEGPGIVERYYATASSAPASVFAVLWKLHNHHLRKVEQQGEKGLGAAYAIRSRLADLVAQFPAGGPNLPPQFPRQLSLEEQGRFALGFYQQLAADRQAARERKAAREAKKDTAN